MILYENRKKKKWPNRFVKYKILRENDNRRQKVLMNKPVAKNTQHTIYQQMAVSEIRQTLWQQQQQQH